MDKQVSKNGSGRKRVVDLKEAPKAPEYLVGAKVTLEASETARVEEINRASENLFAQLGRIRMAFHEQELTIIDAMEKAKAAVLAEVKALAASKQIDITDAAKAGWHYDIPSRTFSRVK